MTLTWKAPIAYREKSMGAYDDEEGAYESPGSNFDYLALLQGKPYPEGMEVPRIYFADPEQKLRHLDCLWLLGGIPLVSARLADFILEQTGSAVQMLRPTAIYAAGTPMPHDYFMINTVHTVNAIDVEQSEASLDEEGDVIYFKKIYLLDDAMAQHAIAREAQSLDLLVAEKLAHQFFTSGFGSKNGISFYKMQRKLIPYVVHD